MDLSLNETQLLIQDATKDFVKRACERDVLLKLEKNPADIMPRYWKQFSEMGWTGMAIPEAFGGSGNELMDVAVLFEELGTGPVPGPLFSSAVLCARILLETATDQQKSELLPEIANGKRVYALALTEAQFGWTPQHISMKASKHGNEYVLSGTKVFVDDAEFATNLLVVSGVEGEPGLSLFNIDVKSTGVSIRPLQGFMSAKSEVSFANVKIPARDVIGERSNTWKDIHQGMITCLPILSAYMVGGCKRVFEMSLAYAGERKQFGQPIGRFPRVQDHIIYLVNHLDAARWTTYEAIWKLETTHESAATGCHMAKAVASESYLRATDYAHEVHAGIGVLREYGLTLHTKMSRSIYHTLGAPKMQYRHIEDTLGLAV